MDSKFAMQKTFDYINPKFNRPSPKAEHHFNVNWFQSQGQFSDSYFKAKSYLFAKKAQTQHGRRICADRAVFIGGVFLMLVNLPQLNLQSSRRVHTFLYRRAPVSRLLLLEKLSHIINIGKLRISDPALSTA